MKKALWLLLLATLLACGPTTADPSANANSAEDEAAVSDTNEDAEEVVEEDEAEAPADNSAETETSPAMVAATNFEDFAPASTVEEAATIREQDWRKGAAEPSVVIIEYGDFQ